MGRVEAMGVHDVNANELVTARVGWGREMVVCGEGKWLGRGEGVDLMQGREMIGHMEGR